jgi:hypothetical protein
LLPQVIGAVLAAVMAAAHIGPVAMAEANIGADAAEAEALPAANMEG